jgi:anti-sigma factor RsiW
MPDCRAIQNRLGRYFDGELPPAERHLVEDHLRQCRRCSADLQEIRGISSAFRESAPTPPIPENLSLRIMENARKQVGSVPPARGFFWFWKNWSLSMRFAAVSVAAAACYIGIVIGSGSLQSRQQPNDEIRWIGMASGVPMIKAYAGSAR